MTTTYYYNYIRTTYLEKYKKKQVKMAAYFLLSYGSIFTNFWLEIDVTFFTLNRQCYVARIQLFYIVLRIEIWIWAVEVEHGNYDNEVLIYQRWFCLTEKSQQCTSNPLNSIHYWQLSG